MEFDRFRDVQAATRGKGNSRRTKKVVHKPAAVEDSKLKLTLQKVGCQPIDGIQEVNLFPTDGKVLHFTKCSSRENGGVVSDSLD